MSDDKIDAPESDRDKPKPAWLAGRDQALERMEKIALAGYRMAFDNEAEISKKILEAVAEADMPNIAFMATHKALAKGKAEAYFNMAEACRSIREKTEIGKGGEVGAIIRHDEPEATEPDQGDKDGNGDRGGSVDAADQGDADPAGV